MKFDIQETGKNMLSAAAGVLTGEWPGIQACVTKAFEDEKEALAAIADARLAGEIDDDEMKSQLDDEVETLTAVLLVCKVKTKVAAQQAINAALKVLTTAIQAGLKAAI
jgi:hypothetical protein